jgi:hypothetical protein
MVSSCKLYMNGQWVKMYMLTVYIIHVECDDIMLSHHLQLDVAYNFIYATNGILVVYVDCNLCLVTNYSHKLRFLFKWHSPYPISFRSNL